MRPARAVALLGGALAAAAPSSSDSAGASASSSLSAASSSLSAAASSLSAAASSPPLTFMLLGDWGGGPLWFENYTTAQQRLCAAGMGAFAAARAVNFTLALGDNFYALGLCNNATLAPYNDTCPNATDPRAGTVEDVRFELTFEAVYTHPALVDLPFFVIAGNHDALGNVSASIAYTDLSPGGRWQHPDFYYKVDRATHANAAAPSEMLTVLMVDTTLCYGIWSDPMHNAMCAAQLAWLERELVASRSAYLFVAGHYPVWSACAHGNTDWAVQVLLPLLVASNASGYISGHDHCGELIAPADAASGGRDLVFVVSGTGDGCCYAESNILGVPAGASLKFLLSAGYNESAPSGFATIAVRPRSGGGAGGGSSFAVAFHSADASLLYESPELLPRTPIAGGGMAAPDYAAAGAQRPSAWAPFRAYPTPPPVPSEADTDTSSCPDAHAEGQGDG